jgi:homoserine O-succinyltransferase
VIKIGLVNNLPESTFAATERRFRHILKAAAGNMPFRLSCFSLSPIVHSPGVVTHISGLKADLRDLYLTSVDGLIVTGAEPRSPCLQDEDYWPALVGLVEWAKENTRSTIWSCLAAHAAVLHLDGIKRVRLDKKCLGVFDCSKVIDNWLTSDLPPSLQVSHSRMHGLEVSDLKDRGYQVLTQSKAVGVDIFSKRQGSEFVFFQGHPEYDALSLQREYLRDISRYLTGEQELYPSIPDGYFDAATIFALEELRDRALDVRNPELIDEFKKISLRPTVTADAEVAATTIFRNWLGYLAGKQDRAFA